MNTAQKLAEDPKVPAKATQDVVNMNPTSGYKPLGIRAVIAAALMIKRKPVKK
jgi:CRISPR/Cas system-associated protein Csm6